MCKDKVTSLVCTSPLTREVDVGEAMQVIRNYQ